MSITDTKKTAIIEAKIKGDTEENIASNQGLHVSVVREIISSAEHEIKEGNFSIKNIARTLHLVENVSDEELRKALDKSMFTAALSIVLRIKDCGNKYDAVALKYNADTLKILKEMTTIGATAETGAKSLFEVLDITANENSQEKIL